MTLTSQTMATIVALGIIMLMLTAVLTDITIKDLLSNSILHNLKKKLTIGSAIIAIIAVILLQYSIAAVVLIAILAEVKEPVLLIMDEGVLIEENGDVNNEQLKAIDGIVSAHSVEMIAVYATTDTAYNKVKELSLSETTRIQAYQKPFDKSDSIAMWLEDQGTQKYEKVLYLASELETTGRFHDIVVDAGIANGGITVHVIKSIYGILAKSKPSNLNEIKVKVWKSETNQEINFGGRKVHPTLSGDLMPPSKDWAWSQGL